MEQLTMTSSSIGVLPTELQPRPNRPSTNALLRRRDNSLVGESSPWPLRALGQTCSAGRNCKLLLAQLPFRQQTAYPQNARSEDGTSCILAKPQVCS